MIKCVVKTASYEGEPIGINGKNIMVEKENTRRFIPPSEVHSPQGQTVIITCLKSLRMAWLVHFDIT